MIIFTDFEGNIVRLTDERLKHILLHPEMNEMLNKIEVTLNNPEYVLQSNADKNVKLFNRYFITKQFGGKYLCVVTKYLDNDAFIITSFLIRELPKGEIIWQKS